MKLYKHLWDFPGGPVVKNRPSITGNMGAIPGWAIKIPHVWGNQAHMSQLESLRCSYWAYATKRACRLELRPAAAKQMSKYLFLICDNKSVNYTCNNWLYMFNQFANLKFYTAETTKRIICILQKKKIQYIYTA